MGIWNVIEKLGRTILGEEAPVARNLGKIEGTIIPETGKRRRRTFSSTPTVLQGVEVLPEYEFIHRALLAGCPSLFVTGRAGTGKSTLIHWLSSKLDSCAVVAPTAVAAISVQGDTIHSFFGLPPEHLDPDETYSPDQKRRRVLENIKFLIVDEVSMVLPNMVDVMSNTLKSVRKNDLPFGGVPTVFVGDLLQLPPVVSSAEEAVYFSHRYKTRFFFSADVFKSQDIIPVNLTKVRRQADAEFIEALSRIRLNDDCRDAVALFNRTCFTGSAQGKVSGIYLVPTNNAARTINSRELDRISGPIKLYEAVVTGNVMANKWRLSVPDRLELKVGARIMFLKNNKPDWINGDLGEIVGLESDHIRVKKDGSDNVVVVGKEIWKKQKYTYDFQTRKIAREVVGTFEQIPVTHGWAITIHKSQGLTLDKLTLDLGGGAFAEGQTYVALSRARAITGITLARPISMGDVRADPAVLQFYRDLGMT